MREASARREAWFCGVAVWVALCLYLACQRGDGPAGGVLAGTKGSYHPTAWLTVHAGQSLGSAARCTDCHELSGLRPASGAPTCATAACHHATVSDFKLAAQHGVRAKRIQDASGGGLRSCQLCHGTDFKGGPSGKACATCHGVQAPHPVRPWRGVGVLTHATTDPSNGPICAQCHLAGSALNPAGHPATPAAAGAEPGCFNNTLCHGDGGAPHPLGTLWRDATSSSFHGPVASQDLVYCQTCHGTPGTTAFAGGSVNTACDACHVDARAHPMPWSQAPSGFPTYQSSHRTSGNRTAACGLCHDVTKGRTAPLPAAPSCYSASFNGVGCHSEGPGQPNHAVPYLGALHTSVTSTGFSQDCANCHVATGTSPVVAAPACTVCHQAASPLTQGSCASCHASPPSGSTFPNVAGTHAKHNALAGVSGNCDSCHSGAGSGSLLHYTVANARPGKNAQRVPPAPVQFASAYNAKSGAATFTPATQTCSNVSCHGGQTTPAWPSGTLTVNTQCTACHVRGTTQYNSQYSGRHGTHEGARYNGAPVTCVDCHSVTSLAGSHFTTLGTQAMEGPASATIGGADTRIPVGRYIPGSRNCTPACHGLETW